MLFHVVSTCFNKMLVCKVSCPSGARVTAASPTFADSIDTGQNGWKGLYKSVQAHMKDIQE
jgi:hypothetical protein